MEHNELKHKKEHIKLSLLMSLNKVQLISVGGGRLNKRRAITSIIPYKIVTIKPRGKTLYNL